MKRVILKKYEVVLYIECPNCNAPTTYFNDDIPRSKELVHECPQCDTKSSVPPLLINVKPSAERRGAILRSAKRILVAQGFSKKEAKKLIDQVYKEGYGLEQVVQEALAAHE